MAGWAWGGMGRGGLGQGVSGWGGMGGEMCCAGVRVLWTLGCVYHAGYKLLQ